MALQLQVEINAMGVRVAFHLQHTQFTNTNYRLLLNSLLWRITVVEFALPQQMIYTCKAETINGVRNEHSVRVKPDHQLINIVKQLKKLGNLVHEIKAHTHTAEKCIRLTII